MRGGSVTAALLVTAIDCVALSSFKETDPASPALRRLHSNWFVSPLEYPAKKQWFSSFPSICPRPAPAAMVPLFRCTDAASDLTDAFARDLLNGLSHHVDSEENSSLFAVRAVLHQAKCWLERLHRIENVKSTFNLEVNNIAYWQQATTTGSSAELSRQVDELEDSVGKFIRLVGSREKFDEMNADIARNFKREEDWFLEFQKRTNLPMTGLRETIDDLARQLKQANAQLPDLIEGKVHGLHEAIKKMQRPTSNAWRFNDMLRSLTCAGFPRETNP